MNLEQLSTIHEIQTLKARYFRLLDTQDWEAFRDVFTEDLEYYIDDPDAAGGAGSDAAKPAFEGPDALVTYLSTSDPQRRSVHHGHMPEIELVDEDTATGIWAVFAWGEYPSRGFTTQTDGHYHETYRRCPDGKWRISRIRLTRLRFQSTGDPAGLPTSSPTR